MPSLVNKIHKKQNRTRRDVISQAKVTCIECGIISGTFRHVRGHINIEHELKCEIICTQSANCNFHCPGDFNCFTLHFIRAHGQFCSGRSTNLGEEEMFYKLRTSKNIIEKVHSAICAEEREVGNKIKKAETKRRNNLESKILNKFKKMPNIGTLDPIVARKQYINYILYFRHK